MISLIYLIYMIGRKKITGIIVQTTNAFCAILVAICPISNSLKPSERF